MSVTVVPLDRDAWYSLAAGFSDANYRQHWDFNVACAARLGSDVEHVRIDVGTELVGLAGVRCNRVPFVGVGVAYIGGGPLTRRGRRHDLAGLAACLDALRQEYVARRRLVLRISPPLAPPEHLEAVTSVYEKGGFGVHASGRRYRTVLLDTSPPEIDLRARMSSRWRRQLRKAERNDFTISSGTGDDLYEKFCDLFDSFIQWKGFDVELDPRFHAGIQRMFSVEAKHLVTLLHHEGELVAGHVASLCGDSAVYVFGATHPDRRELRAGHFIHWHFLQMLKQRKVEWYDLGGIDPDANPGVSDFKVGMGGVDVSSPGPFECGSSRLARTVLQAGEGAYRALRKVRARFDRGGPR
jgi:CelD/BcsL family acetyltransferase involved in cellulose biosynthesis